MVQLSPETIWRASEKELLSLLNSGIFVSKSRKVHFYAPSFMYYKTTYYCSSPTHFPTVSVTGTECALNCKHCGGKVLQTMLPANTPEKLFKLGAELRQNGSLGCLVSGGCLPDGSVPLKQFVPAIEKIKQKLGLTVFVHTGIIDVATAFALKTAGVDAVLIDIVGSNESIRKVYNLNMTVKDYASSLKALHLARLNFVPHVIVGLHHGELKGEFHALKMISSFKPSAIVVIAFMPITGTALGETEPPLAAEIARVIATTRIMFLETPLVLGCMRPKGKHRDKTDLLALKAGVNAIAFPSEEAIKYAETQRYALSFSSYCCAQIYVDAAS